jgi:hypothetical protein
VSGRLKRFLSPGDYENGRAVGVWSCVYLAMTLFAIVSGGTGDDVLMVGLAFVATLPLSVFLVSIHGVWMPAALTVCALVNAFAFWLAFRGSARYPRLDRPLVVPDAAGRKGKLSKRATRKELGDSLHPRKKVGEGYGWFHN